MVPVCVFAKPPVPDRVKTRLASTLGSECAARLASAMFMDVWRCVSACPGVRPILATTEFCELPVKIPGNDIWLQGDGDLGTRLERIISHGLLHAPAVIALGADSPSITISHLLGALRALDANDAVIGPCEDGGFYLLGLRRYSSGLLSDIPWSSSKTCKAVTESLCRHRLTVARLETLFDIDVIDDLKRLKEYLARRPHLAPVTRAWYAENEMGWSSK
jgi:uncharacterized protein